MNSLVYFILTVGLVALIVGCDEAETEAPTTTPRPSSPTTTTTKEADRPEGLADQAENKTLTPPPTVAPKADDSADPKTTAVSVPAATSPGAPRSIPQSVPNVEALPSNANAPVSPELSDADVSVANTPDTGTIAADVVPATTAPEVAVNYQNPDLSNTVIPYLLENHNQIGACREVEYDAEYAASASIVYRVGENRYLAHFACGLLAYQAIQEYYLYEATTDTPLVTALPITYFYTDLNGSLIEESERAIAGFGEYNPATSTVSVFTKGRGLGDCGSLGFYRLEGAQFVVDRFLAKDECDGNFIDPIDYPQVYP